MKVEHLEVLAEEASIAAALADVLPRLLGSITFNIYEHLGKQDLMLRLPERLRGYARWLPANYRILVVVDRDNQDCHELKAELEREAHAAGLKTRKSAGTKAWQVVNRIAIEELEAWYFGDWKAVRKAYPKVPASIPSQAPFRAPDDIKGGTWEALERVLQSAGYFSGGLRKIEAAQTIAPHLEPARNISPSFCALRNVLQEIAVPSARASQ